MNTIRRAALALVLIGTTGCLFENTPPGEMIVTVMDASGAPVEGVTVHVELDGAPRSRASKGSKVTDAAGLVVFGNLDSNEYRVTIGDLPEHLVFAETEAIVFVPENGAAEHEFTALADGATTVRVYGRSHPLDAVLVKLFDLDGNIVAVGRTGSPPQLPGEVTFSGLRRQMYEAHISEYAEWFQFSEPTAPVDLLGYEAYPVAFLGDVLGEWTLEVGVTADGVGLEGVAVDIDYVGNGNPPLRRFTDAQGFMRLDYFPSTRILTISGFDEARYQFPVTTQNAVIPDQPGVTTVLFEGTMSAGDAPVVAINTPGNGARYQDGETVHLSGGASDREDGSLAGSSLVWSSDLDGQLGTGAALAWSVASAGEHVISLTATDSDGNTAEASVQITIVPNQWPMVAILSPDDGAAITEGDPVEFRGSASDPEDGPLFGPALVWTSDLDGPIGTDEFLVTSELSVGTHVVRLAATDSRGLTVTASVTIDVAPNAAPTVLISSPAAGQSFTLGEPVTFAGSASDAEDGALTGGSLLWSSDRDGNLGSGESFTRDDLSMGTHVVTLTATDSHGARASASITMAVDNTPPVVTITQPVSGSTYLAGQNVSFVGTATDGEDGPLSGASLVWSSSLDGIFGTGASISFSDLRVGSHVISLNATDSDGATSRASANIQIQGSGAATINGRVEVPGVGIEGVTVSAVGPATATTITDTNGDYLLTDLPPGTYTLSISNTPSWTTFEITSRVVTVGPGQTISITFTGTGG